MRKHFFQLRGYSDFIIFFFSPLLGVRAEVMWPGNHQQHSILFLLFRH
jgi:hypothetical protein